MENYTQFYQNLKSVKGRIEREKEDPQPGIVLDIMLKKVNGLIEVMEKGNIPKDYERLEYITEEEIYEEIERSSIINI